MGMMRVVCVMGERWVDSAQRARVRPKPTTLPRRPEWGQDPECHAEDDGILKMGTVQKHREM